MAQQPNNRNSSEWKEGQKCEVYSRARKRWMKGQVLVIFNEEDGQWIRVKYGRSVEEMSANDPNLRVIGSGQQKTQHIQSSRDLHHRNDLHSEGQRVSKEHVAFKGNKLKWQNVVEAVKQELYPLISTATGQSVKELMDSNTLKPNDLSDKAIGKVIEKMKDKKVLYNKEIEYIRDLVKRANTFKWDETENDAISDDLHQFKNDDNLNLKYPGLTVNLLIDIYSVHKALMFGQFKFTKFTKKDFMDNIQETEERVFGDAICSPILKKHESSLNLSLHPFYVINDDIFEVMAFHFAVSSMVNRLNQKNGKYNELNIRSIVVPAAITSIYDSQIEHKSSIKDISCHLKAISPSNLHLCRRIEFNINDVASVSDVLFATYQRIECDDPRNVVIVLNRRMEQNTVHLFECNDLKELRNLYRNYFIGFDFNVQCQPHGDNAEDIIRPHPLVRCWMTFGVNQRMRFYPESLLWIAPRLFARSDRLTANGMVNRLYGAEYKWGWRVNLDDPIFDRFYHIITRYEHITNNYNRNAMVSSSKTESDCGLRDHLERGSHRNIYGKLHHFVVEQAFDSDAVLEDSLASKRMNDAKNSNIFRFLTASGFETHFRTFRLSLIRYRGTICCTENVQSFEECPYIDDVVAALQRLKDCRLDIDATNFWHFDLESIVSSWAHILSVHKLLSDVDDHKERKQQLRNYILQRVQCGEGTKCIALTAQRERRRERKREERVEEEPDEISAQIEAVTDTLFGIHCQLFHGQNEQNRNAQSDDEQDVESRFKTTVFNTTATTEQKQDDESKDDEDVEKAPGAIDFGRSVLRWLKADDSPRFNSLREELTMNPHSTIDYVFYDRLRRVSAALSKDSGCTVDETLGLKAYSDTNEFQAALSRAHWHSSTQEERRSFYHWAMTLYRVHLRCALPIPPATASGTTPRPLWTGFNILLSLGHELGAYYGPLSTTKSKSVAKGFSKGKGQIYKFGSSYINLLRCTVGIDMEGISCYPQEQEVMLYHSILPIQSTTTEAGDAGDLVNHLLYSLQSRATPIVRDKAFYNKLGIKWDRNWIPLIVSHKLLLAETQCARMTVIDRLAKELEISFFELMLLVRVNMFVHDDCNLRLRKTSKTLSDLLSQFEIGICFGDQILKMQLIQVDADSFVIPCHSLMETISDSVGLSIFCKSRDNTFDFVKIHYLMMSRYEMKLERPLYIKETINAPPSEPDIGINGGIVFKSSSDIFIDPNGVIITIQESITVISESTITNKGVIRSKLAKVQSRGDHSICLVAPSFLNRGTIQCDSANDFIRVICNRFENTGAMSPEPEIVINSNLNHDATPLMVEHMIRCLSDRKEPIVSAEAFYKDHGVKWTTTWIPLIMSHEMLLDATECNRMPIIERLANELKIILFENVWKICGAMVVDDELNLKVTKTSRISQEIFTQFVFRVGFGEKFGDCNLQCAPEDIDSFIIYCSSLMEMISDFIGLSVFMKAKDDSFDFVKVKEDLLMPRYDLKRETPLNIKRAFNVIPRDLNIGVSGNSMIKCSADIIISKTGGIAATVNKAMVPAMDAKRRMTAVIYVVSDGSVINNGTVSCSASGRVKRKGPAVRIVADSFSNHGTVRCDDDSGSVHIKCSHFENTGTVYPAPNIIVGHIGMRKMKGTAVWSNSKQMVPMTVYDHRGHYGHRYDHPNNLLKDDTDAYYQSGSNNSVGDWIIFRLNTNTMIKPSAVSIRNSDDMYEAIKSIALWMGKDDGKWTKICKDITGIHRKNRKPQKFNLSLIISDEQLLAEGPDLLMLEVLENWGYHYNRFYSFNLYGYPLIDEDGNTGKETKSIGGLLRKFKWKK